MYTGHLGIALAAKRVRPSVPLWVLIASTQACDWVDAVGWLVGHDDTASSRWLVFGDWTAQMVSHSVPAVLAIAAVLAGVYYARVRDGAGAAIVAVVALSHVPADYLTAVKPTWPGGPRIGLSLYAHPIADLLAEGAFVGAGWLLYRRTLPQGRGATSAAWLMLGALVVLQAFVSATRFHILGAM
jgi:hypothetical protein